MRSGPITLPHSPSSRLRGDRIRCSPAEALCEGGSSCDIALASAFAKATADRSRAIPAPKSAKARISTTKGRVEKSRKRGRCVWLRIAAQGAASRALQKINRCRAKRDRGNVDALDPFPALDPANIGPHLEIVHCPVLAELCARDAILSANRSIVRLIATAMAASLVSVACWMKLSRSLRKT